MPRDLEEWLRAISHHLDLVEAGAAMCRPQVEALPGQPSFETWAEAELVRCETVLTCALDDVRTALKTFRGKEIVT